jgi:ligand-binding sensor domain-containing protein
VRFDGNEKKVYRYKPEDSSSLAESSITTLMQSSDSLIWIGTKNGISIHDPSKGYFTNFQKQSDNFYFPADWVLCFYELSPDEIWIGTNQGLVKVDRPEMSFELIKLHYNEIQNDRGNVLRWVNKISIDPRDSSRLILATRGGLLLFDRSETKILTDYESNVDHLYKCTSLFIDGDTLLYTGEWNTGLKVFDLVNETWEIKNPPGQPNLNLHEILPKNNNELWLATVGKGLGTYNKTTEEFRFIENDPSEPKSPASDWIHNLFSKEGTIWLLTNKGISIHDPHYRSFSFVIPPYDASFINNFFYDTSARRLYLCCNHTKGLIYLDKNNQEWGLIPWKSEKSNLCIYNTLKDSNGEIWLNTNKGLMTLDEEKNIIEIYYDSNQKTVTGRDTVFTSLFEDSRRFLWIGTRFDNIFCIDPERKNVQHYTDGKDIPGEVESTRDYDVIKEDRYGRIWFGSYNGIAVFDPSVNKFIETFSDTLKRLGLNNKVTWGIESDTLNRIFLSIDDEGLLRIDEPEKGDIHVKLYHLNHGLNDLNLFGMDQDPYGNIWIINEGISCFNPYEETFLTIDTRNGLHRNKNWGNSIYIDPEGNIYLNSNRGFETININNIPENDVITNLLIEELEINSIIKKLPELRKENAVYFQFFN